MKFTQEFFLAVEVVRNVPKEKPVTAAKLAAKLGTTEFFLQRIIGKLRKASLVNVKKGPDGGVFASGKLTDTTVLDVYRAIGAKGPKVKQGSFMAGVHTNVLTLLGSERIPTSGLETRDG